MKSRKQSEIYVLATNHLKKHGTPALALTSFIERVTAGAALLTALIPKAAIENEALRFLGEVVADMNGEGPESSSPDSRGGHTTTDVQAICASPAQNSGGHRTHDDHLSLAPAGSQAEGGQDVTDALPSVAAPAREPTGIQRAAHRDVGKASARTVLDTFKITMRQGSVVPVGDIAVASYGRLIAASGKRAWVTSREHNTLCLLKDMADRQAHVPSGALTRDIFDGAVVLSAIKMAQKLSTPYVENNREIIDA